MKCWIVILNRINQISNLNSCFQFFFYFSNKGLLRSFTFFNLSTWELPLSFKISITSCCCKYLLFSLIESQITAATTLIVFILIISHSLISSQEIALCIFKFSYQLLKFFILIPFFRSIFNHFIMLRNSKITL